MAVYVHITETCEAEAAAHGQTRFVESVRDKVVATQTIGTFDQFLPSHFIKKGLGRSFRLIGYRYPIGDDELVLLVRTLPRGGNEYEWFLGSLETRPDFVEEQTVPPKEDLARIYADLTSTQPVAALPGLDDEERAWLHEVFRDERGKDDLVVLETDAWVKRARSRGNLEFLVLFHEAIEKIDLRTSDATVAPQVAWDARRRAGVIYVYRPDLRRLLLLEAIRTQSEADEAVRAWAAKLTEAASQGHDLARLAGRAYPYLMVLDQDLWLRIEKDEEANLALSPEEAGLLESIREPDPTTTFGYPLFINGRAGSGKSTMLQYLAADYIEFGLRRSTRTQPIYMTSSRDLLERARTTVRGLLTVHHSRLLENSIDDAEIDRALQSSFVVFHEYLQSLLDPEDRGRFPADKRVSYAEFRRLWAEDFSRRPEAKKITVDLAWHTIRSYIKGTRSEEDDELGPEEFDALPRKRRSVSPETYRRVFSLVWEGWYKRLCEDRGLWDDQDLAARVLASGKARSAQLAAVFCDEAQDFTPLELEIIFQLSLFSQRSLLPEELKRVPIAFAGDPLQTINPTGFRWDAVQADFHEKYRAVLDPKRGRDVEISYRELRFNYRSNPGIVRFCNLIQLVRGAVLDRQDVLPQDAWWVDTPSQTVWFAADDGATAGQLQQRPELIKLVNCEEGEETSYAERDPILRDLGLEANSVYRNVLGPTRAKGLEFPAVVLYRFSESAPPQFARVLAGEVPLGDDPESELPYEYFFNRLYVAASRAKTQLVVVDSPAAFREFWRFATDADLVDRWIRRLRNPEPWKDSVAYLVPGRVESWTGERIDPTEQAREFAEKGRQSRDAYLMRQASLGFRAAGQPIEAARCTAEALVFEGKLAEAGRRYQEANLHDDAYRCFWESRAFDEIRRMSTEPQYASRLEGRAADFMAAPRDVSAAFVEEVVRAAERADWRRAAIESGTWLVVFRAMLEALTRSKKPATTVPVRMAYEVLAQLGGDGLDLPPGQLGTLAFAAGDNATAVSLWERSGDTDRDEYGRAKASTAPFPENVVWLGRLKAHSEVVSEWRKHASASRKPIVLDDAAARAVADAALSVGDLQLAAEMLERRPDETRIGALLKEAVKRNDAESARRGAIQAVRRMATAHEWSRIVRFAEAGEIGGPSKGGTALRPLLESGDGEDGPLRIVLDELAASIDLAADSSSGQGPITEFLHRTFVAKGFAAAAEYGVPIATSGAAIERAGRITDAIQYYEAILRDKRASAQDRAFAAERLVRSLERHAEYLRARGEGAQALRQEARARQVRETTGLKGRRVTEFPTPDAATRATAPKALLTGPFRFVSSPVHQRLRIEHTDRFETVTVDGSELSLRGDVAVEASEDSEQERRIWRVPAWNATIRLSPGSRGLRVQLEADGLRADVTIPKAAG